MEKKLFMRTRLPSDRLSGSVLSTFSKRHDDIDRQELFGTVLPKEGRG